MDHRLRPQHDAESTPQPHDHHSVWQSSDWQSSAGPSSDWQSSAGQSQSAPSQSAQRRAGQVLYRPTLTYQAVDPLGYPSVPPQIVSDGRAYQAEIARLRQWLSVEQTRNAQQIQQIQHAAHQARNEQATRFLAQIDALKRQLAESDQASEQEKQQLNNDLSRLRTQLDRSKESLHAQADQAESLKREVANVAMAASSEQQSLKQHFQSVVSRQDAIMRDQDGSNKKLLSQLGEKDNLLAQWQLAHSNAVTLCEVYGRKHRNEDVRFAALQDQHDRLKEQASEEFALCEEEIEMLENTITILRTDHEAVELTNADLDHRNDELESVVAELQSDIESVMVQFSRDRQESKRAVDALEQQFKTTNARLIAASEEKKSLLESLAKLKRVADDFDASLFAKDQEISATKKLAEDSQRQGQQLRREHADLVNQDVEMRNRIRGLTGDVSDLQAKLAESEDRAGHAEQTAAERERQIREMQSAARAAEANATLRANEAEQQYAIELERLESTIEQRSQSDSAAAQRESKLLARIAELEDHYAASRHAATASSAEKDRLQELVDQQGVRVGELQANAEAKASRVVLLEETLAELQLEISCRSESADQINRDLDQHRTQLAEFADKIATQQHLIEVRDQQLADANRQLEQQQLTERERQHHSQLAQQRTIDALNQNLLQSHAQRDVLVAQIDTSAEKIKELEAALENWAVHESPINEVKRLSKELSRRIGNHARERDALLERIEQLSASRTVSRAA